MLYPNFYSSNVLSNKLTFVQRTRHPESKSSHTIQSTEIRNNNLKEISTLQITPYAYPLPKISTILTLLLKQSAGKRQSADAWHAVSHIIYISRHVAFNLAYYSVSQLLVLCNTALSRFEAPDQRI